MRFCTNSLGENAITHPDQIAAIVRIEKATGTPLIVFGADGCYSHIGQHSSIAREYYLDDTRPPNTPEERDACAALVREWDDLPGCAIVREVKRLPAGAWG